MASLMNFFAKADALDWLATFVGPAALFTHSGQIVEANDGFLRTYHRTNIDLLMRQLVDRAGAFRISKAVRRGQILDEVIESLHIRVGPIGSLSLVRLYPAEKATLTPVLPQLFVTDVPTPSPTRASLKSDASSLRTGLAQLIADAPIGVARLDRRDARGAIITEANPAFIHITGAGVGSVLSSLIVSADADGLGRLEVGSARPVELGLQVEGGRTCEAWLLEDGDLGAA